MKKFWLLVAVVAICLAAGCVGEVKTYTDSGQAISIGVNQEFIIALGSLIRPPAMAGRKATMRPCWSWWKRHIKRVSRQNRVWWVLVVLSSSVLRR